MMMMVLFVLPLCSYLMCVVSLSLSPSVHSNERVWLLWGSNDRVVVVGAVS